MHMFSDDLWRTLAALKCLFKRCNRKVLTFAQALLLPFSLDLGN